MSLTPAQGAIAGRYAASIASLQAFVANATTAVANNAALSGMAFTFSINATQIQIVIDLPAGDTALVLNDLIDKANGLAAQYTAALAAM